MARDAERVLDGSMELGEISRTPRLVARQNPRQRLQKRTFANARMARAGTGRNFTLRRTFFGKLVESGVERNRRVMERLQFRKSKALLENVAFCFDKISREVAEIWDLPAEVIQSEKIWARIRELRARFDS